MPGPIISVVGVVVVGGGGGGVFIILLLFPLLVYICY